jgi:hypothetical protein
MTATTRARIAVGTLFVVMSIVGAAAIYFHWSTANASIATGRAILFVVVMSCVSLAGYLLYEKQFSPEPIETNTEGVEFKYSPLYWPALGFGILVQAILGILSALMLDLGETLNIFQVAFVGHWAGMLFILVRRPLSPTKTDIVFIRWGTPLLMLATVLIARQVWNVIGDSDRSGWQRLWDYLGHH